MCLLFGAAAPTASAETRDYGSFDGPDAIFVDVSEEFITDGLPLFDEPTLAGNSLVFNPASFEAFSEDGGVDLTGSILTMEILSTNELGMSSIEIVEAGDYALGGIGTNVTLAQIGAPVMIQIIEVDGQSLERRILIDAALEFTPSDGIFMLLNDQNGAGIIWEGRLTIDLDAALAANNIDGAVTGVWFIMNNSLTAVSEPGSLAFVKKKTVSIGVTPVVPEPSSAVLACLGLLALLGASWRRRRR
ncbi:MAG: PEP-CTERM sorting domain-containing protein [Planctomycetes bacterium]|nr:PEP-CTERM sorting domain-containing protein [Planctomycetota bacterium]